MPPIEEHISGPSAGVIAYVAPNQPGIPTWLGNAEREIVVTFDRADNGSDTEYIINIEENGDSSYYVNAVNIYSANDTLIFTSDQGGPVSINVTAGDLTPSTASVVLQDLMNANTTLTGSGTITFAITNNANKFTIDAGSGHTIALTYSGSDGAETWGFTGDAAAAQTITSDTYALFNKMVGTEGWRAISTDLAGIVRIMGLSAPSTPLPYRFRVKARNSYNTALETAYSSWSEIMLPHIDLALSPASNSLSYECTTGDCKISDLTVTEIGELYPGQFTIAYTLTRLHNTSTKTNVKIYYSINGGSSYTELTGTTNTFGDNTSRFDVTITSGYSTTYTYDGTGTSPLFVSNGLAAGYMLTINSSTFSTANNGSFRVLSLTETAVTVENRAGVAEENKVLSASDSMTSTISIGGAITTLTASSSGTANSNKWATCVVLGNSYYKTGLVIKVVPYDEATGGSAGTAATTTVTVDNRPKAVTIAEFSDFSWDKDTTPEIIADMGSVVCGTAVYFVLRVVNNTTLEETTYSSAERPTGWYYEQTADGGSSVRNAETGWDTGWTACTYAGVSYTYLYPYIASGNRIRYIFQDALSQGTTYTITLYQAEYISELV